MKRFCADLKEHANRMTNYEMKSVDPLTEKERESQKSKAVSYMLKRILY